MVGAEHGQRPTENGAPGTPEVHDLGAGDCTDGPIASASAEGPTPKVYSTYLRIAGVGPLNLLAVGA